MWFSVYPGQTNSPVEAFITGKTFLEKPSRITNIPIGERFGAQHNYIMIKVLAITTGGTITIAGTSANDVTSVPIIGNTEIITIDTTLNQMYKTVNLWLEITTITITGGGITGLTYETWTVAQNSLLSRDFVIDGYRLETVAGTTGSKSDIRWFIEKIQDDGDKKMQIVPLEDIMIDNETNQITDFVRSGSRNYTATSPADIWPDESTYLFQQSDFNSYFTLNENYIYGQSKNEGIVLRITGNTLGGPSGTPYIHLQLSYYYLS